MRPLLEPPPRPLSNVTLVGLVAAVVLATGVLVLRYVQGARPGRAQPEPATWSAPPADAGSIRLRRGESSPERTQPAACEPLRLSERPGSAAIGAGVDAQPSLWAPPELGG